MARRLRFIPSGSLVEVTCRTLHGRFLLRPSKRLRSATLGVIGRAQRLYGVQIHAFVFLSNHSHLLLTVDSAQQLASFMQHLNSNLAREIGRLQGWREKFWGRRYQAILVSGEERAQAARLRYLLEQGVKEGLVARPQDWPGPHSTSALLDGKTRLRGLWRDRTGEFHARHRGEQPRAQDFLSTEIVILSALPCWRHHSAERIRNTLHGLVHDIIASAAQEHQRRGTQPMGAKAIKTQKAHETPLSSKRSPAPDFHAATKAARNELRNAYALFCAAYRQAAEKLKNGDLRVLFPEGSFPPPLPFVPG